MNGIVQRTGIDIVQLHGKEDASFIDKIVVPCIKVIHIPALSTTSDVNQGQENGADDARIVQAVLSEVEGLKGKAVALLFDSKLPGSQTSGGSGKTFDWKLVEQLAGVPVLLAGGLTAENVSSVGSVNGVFGVDVSSGIEERSGKKHIQKMKAFISNARAASIIVS